MFASFANREAASETVRGVLETRLRALVVLVVFFVGFPLGLIEGLGSWA